MRRFLNLAVAALFVLLVFAGEFERVEKRHLRAGARRLERLCGWALSKGLKGQAEWALEWALKLGLDEEEAGKLKAKIEGLPEEKKEEKVLREWERRRRVACRDVARQLEKIFKAGRSVTDKEALKRLDEYLFWMLELEGTRRRWRYLEDEIKAALRVGAFERAAALAQRGLKLTPPKNIAAKLQDTLDKVKIDRVILEKVDNHPLRYYISLPRGYSRRAKRRWPVLITIDGSGSGFKGRAFSYTKARSNLPLIVVAPCTFSNTNSWKKYTKWYDKKTVEEATKNPLAWDEKALLALIEHLKKHYNTQNQVYITGFSGGGIPCYMMIFKHPDLLAGASPTCANFYQNYTRMKGRFKPEDLNFPIHIITGGKDPHAKKIQRRGANIPGIDAQTEEALRQLRLLGYPNIKHTCYPEMGHSAACNRVIATLKPYILGQKKRGDKLD